MELARAALSPPIDKEKKAVEHLSSALDELLNAAEVIVGSTLASVAQMLREKIFRGVSDAFDSRFFTLVSHLACTPNSRQSLVRDPKRILGTV